MESGNGDRRVTYFQTFIAKSRNTFQKRSKARSHVVGNSQAWIRNTYSGRPPASPPIFILQELAIFLFIARSRNIILLSINIARFRNCSYSGIVLNRGPTLHLIPFTGWKLSKHSAVITIKSKYIPIIKYMNINILNKNINEHSNFSYYE